MFDAFRNFVAEFVDGDRHPSQFADDDYRLAAAALLVHAAAIDGDMLQAERDQLHAIVKRRFGLDDGAADELIDKATVAEQEAVDLYHFTSLLNRTLDEEGRARIVEMMSHLRSAAWFDRVRDQAAGHHVRHQLTRHVQSPRFRRRW